MMRHVDPTNEMTDKELQEWANRWCDKHLGSLPENWADIANEESERCGWDCDPLVKRWIIHHIIKSEGRAGLGEWGDSWCDEILVYAKKEWPEAHACLTADSHIEGLRAMSDRAAILGGC